VLTALSLLLFSPLFYLVIVLVKLDSPGPAFFKQERIGRNFKAFGLIKFRSMVLPRNGRKAAFEPGGNRRVTRVGSFLRKLKLDELPELYNVLNGDLSIVGPIPEVEAYVRAYPEEFKTILKIRPGLSDYASIKYRDEEAILAGQSDPEVHYLTVILPDKLRLAQRYAEEILFITDLRIIRNTLRSIMAL
jgi:lipopolysaccharide/colanic/teichoic acid biosynthesis glycosyltransferase